MTGPQAFRSVGCLVNHLLPVGRVVALVRVVAYDGVLVLHEEGLPDRRQAVVRDRLTACCDVRDKLPRFAPVGGGVEVDVGAREVRGDRVASQQDRVLGEVSEFLIENVEERLVAETCRQYACVLDVAVRRKESGIAHTEPVRRVLDARDLVPAVTPVVGPVDGEVHQGRLRAVVLPGR